MLELLQGFDVSKYLNVLTTIGAVAVGLPLLLRAVHAFLLLIPGNQGEAAVEKLLSLSEKLAQLVVKVFPKK